MGGGSSKIDGVLSEAPESTRVFGLENFGNTCYANSVLQALYSCHPFRAHVLQHSRVEAHENDDSLLRRLGELFETIEDQKKKTGVVAPRKFVSKVRSENALFSGYMHQDAHEFLNYVLNSISELLEKREKEKIERKGSKGVGTASVDRGDTPPKPKTWVHNIFAGVLSTETTCLNCECVSTRDEEFLDLSIDISPNASISGCLRQFSELEVMRGDQKYHCDSCNSLQEATRGMRVKALPTVLALHLKRFKYMEHLQRHQKLHSRVVFPRELRLFTTTGHATRDDRMYDLLAVVVHVGAGPSHGHYVALVRMWQTPHWIVFDDDVVRLVDASAIDEFFGSPDVASARGTSTGYILFYQTRPGAVGDAVPVYPSPDEPVDPAGDDVEDPVSSVP